MSNQSYRAYDPERDAKAIIRIWQEVGWIKDDEKEIAALLDVLQMGSVSVATLDGTAECVTQWTSGSLRYQDETLALGAVLAVTTSHIARKLGFAKGLTARSLAQQYEQGMEVSALGMFDQGFYNKLGYGTGTSENRIQFDPATLTVEYPFRPPTRLGPDQHQAVHQALSQRQMFHGSIVLEPAAVIQSLMRWTEKPFGLGYFDGPGETLSHFIWGSTEGEHGPYEIYAYAYQGKDQLMELLALIKSLADQVSSFKMLEPGAIQFQDLLRQPFRTRRQSQGGSHEQSFHAAAYWQLRILNLESCLAKTHCPGPGIKFNLALTDPLAELLEGDARWSGLAGDWCIHIGEESSARVGTEAGLPQMQATINAFSRMWFGVRPASSLAVTDALEAEPELLDSLDRVLRLPRPHFGWDF